LSKSHLPETKAKKAEGLKRLVKLYENHCGKTITTQQMAKKINNMKARLKKKTDMKKTGKKRNKLCEWEKNLYNLMDADSNPTLNKIPGM
jgi:hypothetical protein